jgi:hypothetical protein
MEVAISGHHAGPFSAMPRAPLFAVLLVLIALCSMLASAAEHEAAPRQPSSKEAGRSDPGNDAPVLRGSWPD